MHIYEVDAFAKAAFQGNPAGVCLFVEDQSEEWMQHMAEEVNVSETAFLRPVNGGYSLRWFTPETEVDLCGHATLASAHILYSQGYADPSGEIVFHTKSGILRARSIDGMIELDFPAKPPVSADPPPNLAEALGVTPLYTGRNKMDYIVEIEGEDALRRLTPDIPLLSRMDARGVIVTARSDSGDYDFVSRFFAPRVGIAEDPVTGSAHCCLAPYWSMVLGKDDFHAYQASRRGGELWLRLDGERVFIRGYGVTVYMGEIV